MGGLSRPDGGASQDERICCMQLRKPIEIFYSTSASWLASIAATLRYDQWWFHFTPLCLTFSDAFWSAVTCFPLYLKPGFWGEGRRKMPQTLNANKKQNDANWWKSHSIRFLLAGRCGEKEKGGIFKVAELKPRVEKYSYREHLRKTCMKNPKSDWSRHTSFAFVSHLFSS